MLSWVLKYLKYKKGARDFGGDGTILHLGWAGDYTAHAFVKTLELNQKTWIVLYANNDFVLKILTVDFFSLSPPHIKDTDLTTLNLKALCIKNSSH